MIRFQILGETPAKKNSKIITKNKKLLPSARFQKWHADAMVQLDLQCRIDKPIEKECEIKLVFYHGDKLRRDSDNGTSSILDLLCDKGILSDDRWQIVRKLLVENLYEKNNARCVIEIRPYTPEG